MSCVQAVDARDVDHAVECFEAATACDCANRTDLCNRCMIIGLLREAPRFEAAPLPW